MCWFLFLLPSALVVLSPSVISLLAWRFLYLPSAVLLGVVAYVLVSRLRPKVVAIGVVVALSAAYAVEIYPKNAHFGQDERAFWLGIKNPGREDALVRFNVGANALFVDEKKALGLFDGILNAPDQPFHEMLRTRIYEELAIFYTVKKDFPKAEAYFDDLLKTGERQSLNFYFNYSYFLAFSGKSRKVSSSS